VGGDLRWALKKAIQSLRLRLHSGLRQSGCACARLVFGIHSAALRTGSKAVPLQNNDIFNSLCEAVPLSKTISFSAKLNDLKCWATGPLNLVLDS
jgi:hypothetical protein